MKTFVLAVSPVKGQRGWKVQIRTCWARFWPIWCHCSWKGGLYTWSRLLQVDVICVGGFQYLSDRQGDKSWQKRNSLSICKQSSMDANKDGRFNFPRDSFPVNTNNWICVCLFSIIQPDISTLPQELDNEEAPNMTASPTLTKYESC